MSGAGHDAAPPIAAAQLSRLVGELRREHAADIAALLTWIAGERHERLVLDLYIEALTGRRAMLAPTPRVAVSSGFETGAEAVDAQQVVEAPVVVPQSWLSAARRVAAAHGHGPEALMGPLGRGELAHVRWALWAELMAERRPDGQHRYTMAGLARRFGVDTATVRHGLRRHRELTNSEAAA